MDTDVLVLSKDEQACFEDYVRNDERSLNRRELHGLYGLFLLKTGLRGGELCACQWSDYNEVNGTLTINKSRTVSKNHPKQEGVTTKYVNAEKSKKIKRLVLGHSLLYATTRKDSQ